jgi:hypothetical protein
MIPHPHYLKSKEPGDRPFICITDYSVLINDLGSTLPNVSRIIIVKGRNCNVSLDGCTLDPSVHAYYIVCA